MLAIKPAPLTGREIRFIIEYFEMSYGDFAKLFGVSHAAVLKWEKEKSRMNPSTETCLRLYLLNHLQIADSEFKENYLKILNLSKVENERIPLEIDADKIAC